MSTAKNDFVTGKKKCTLTNINELASDANTDHLPISEFDLDEFVNDPAITIIGKRGAGKSWLIKNIIQHQLEKEKLDEILVFSSTDKMNKFYSDFVENVQHKLDFDILSQVLEKQAKNIEDGSPKKMLIVFDDCCAQKGEWVKNASMQELLFNGRHYHISYILSTQFPLGITPELRSNFDYIFLLADDIISNLKRMYDHYAGIFPKFNTFKQVYQSLTEDFSTMVIINRGSKKTIEEKVKWFKAQNVTITGLIPAIVKTEIIDEFSFMFEDHDAGKYPKKKTHSKKQFIEPEALIFSENDPMFKNSFIETPKFVLSAVSTPTQHPNTFFDVVSNESIFKSPIKKNKNVLNKQDDVANAMINLYDHLKDDIKNKNKYDVLYKIVMCNEAIIKHGILLNENKINTIISANLKIAELCGMPETPNDVDLEIEDIEDGESTF